MFSLPEYLHFMFDDLISLTHTRREREREEGGEAGWMLKVSPAAARALFQALLVFKFHVPATAEHSCVRGACRNLSSLPTFRDSLSAVHCKAQTVTVLPVLSVASSKVPSERRGENKEMEWMWCSCCHALHLVSLIILQNVINKTTIKILWQEHERHDEQICTPQCYITHLSLSFSVFFCTISLSFLDMELCVL